MLETHSDRLSHAPCTTSWAIYCTFDMMPKISSSFSGCKIIISASKRHLVRNKRCRRRGTKMHCRSPLVTRQPTQVLGLPIRPSGKLWTIISSSTPRIFHYRRWVVLCSKRHHLRRARTGRNSISTYSKPLMTPG